MKLLDGRLLMEAMPLIQKLLQRNNQGPRTQVHFDTSAASFPESAFLEALVAFKSLPDFEQRLSTTNGHGQSLLHLAVHLRYRDLVQRLVDWGMDFNIQDVNRFTALDAAHLCDDSSIVAILEKRGAIALVLGVPGQPPTNPAGVMTGTAVDHAQEITLDNQANCERTDETYLLPHILLSIEPKLDLEALGDCVARFVLYFALPSRPLMSTRRIFINPSHEPSRGTTSGLKIPGPPRLDAREHPEGHHFPSLYPSDNEDESAYIPTRSISLKTDPGSGPGGEGADSG
jgi:ankyrin repeat protein